MILSAVLQWGWPLTEGKGQLWGAVAFILQLPHLKIGLCVGFLVNSLSYGISYIVLDVMPFKWQWWSSPLSCGFHVNSSSLLPREFTMLLINILFLLGLPSFQFVLYSSLQRLFSLSHSLRKPFLWLCTCVCSYTWSKKLTGASAQSLSCCERGEVVCVLFYWSPVTWLQERGKK